MHYGSSINTYSVIDRTEEPVRSIEGTGFYG